MRELQQKAVGEARLAGPRSITGRTHVRGLVVATLVALLMTFVGAFGTSELPLVRRLMFWIILMESGALVGIGASTSVRSWGRLARQPFIEGAAISLLVALPLTLIVSGTGALFFGPQALDFAKAATLFVSVFVITAVVTALNYISARADIANPSTSRSQPSDPDLITSADFAAQLPSSVPAVPMTPRLADRLAPRLRLAPIYALEAEDHYVRVHTAAGSQLLLLRLSDAIVELDGLNGNQTHRSWWVARDAVTSARKGDGRGELTLVNGNVVPISRSALTTLSSEGWFAGTTAL